MRTLFKLVVFGTLGLAALAALGVVSFLVLVIGGALFGVVFGLASAVIGLALAAIKIVLFVALPVLCVLWLLKKLFARRGESTYV